MFDFLLAGGNLPFVVSILLMLLIAMVEGVGSLLGAGISGFLDSLIPDLDLDLDIDADLDVDLHAPEVLEPSGLTKLLGWLRIGQVPALMLLIIFLTTFGLLGLCLQSAVQKVFGSLLPALLAVVPVLFVSLPIVRVLGGWLGHIMPQDETYAVAEEEFIGRTALITIGKATPGKPTSARLIDQHGTVHYVMVEPDEEGVVFETGQTVILVRQNGSVFQAIKNTSEALQNENLH